MQQPRHPALWQGRTSPCRRPRRCRCRPSAPARSRAAGSFGGCPPPQAAAGPPSSRRAETERGPGAAPRSPRALARTRRAAAHHGAARAARLQHTARPRSRPAAGRHPRPGRPAPAAECRSPAEQRRARARLALTAPASQLRPPVRGAGADPAARRPPSHPRLRHRDTRSLPGGQRGAAGAQRGGPARSCRARAHSAAPRPEWSTTPSRSPALPARPRRAGSTRTGPDPLRAFRGTGGVGIARRREDPTGRLGG